MEISAVPVRRDIRFVEKAERERFFYCLKFLSVLPPQEEGNFRKFNVAWKVENGQRYYKNVSPRNIHDEFIASHQTCCEHGNVYFAYYHRHLMTCFEIALNYAEEVLLAGSARLPPNLYDTYKKNFDAVFARYKVVADARKKEIGLPATASLPQLSAHYWNPLDYTANISIPEQLQPRSPDAMDQLYFAVNSHYAWNFNFSTRWFGANTGSQPRIPFNFQTMGFFQSQPASYSDVENQIIYGTLNPRSTSSDEFFGVDAIDQYGMTFIANSASDLNLYKNYQKLQETGSSIDVCTLDQQEINTLFGSKVKNLHWISKAERSILSTENSIKAYTYNKALPHFQFAYSLYKKSNVFIKDYISTQSINIENSMEKSHNTMHNLLQLFMSDSQISITNPIFFLYHAWIDYQLEVKIRMIRTSPTSNKAEYSYTKSFLDTRIKPFSVLDQVSGPTQLKYGEYYIFEWSNPLTRFYPQFNQPLTPSDSQVAFKSRNFILNDANKGIRRSDELSTFYKQQYLPNNAQRYSYYKNFSKFIFDYNYEIHNYDSKGARHPVVMKDSIVAIPSYIKDIFNDYDSDWNQNKTGLDSTPPKLGAAEEDDKKLAYERRNLAKAIRMTIGGYARYSSSIKSTVVPIDFKITEKGEKTLKFTEENLNILKRGIVISVAALFTRGVGSSMCPNCQDEKEYFIFGSEKLAEMSEQLFCEVSRNLTRKTFIKIEKEKVVDKYDSKISELFSLSTPRPVFSRLQLIEGAQQVDFIVQFKGNENYETSHITLSLHSYSVQDNKLEHIVIRKKQILDGTEFQFPRLLGVNTSKYHYDYVYRHVEGNVVNGEERIDFSFDINLRYRLITFLVLIEEKFDEKNERYLDVQVVDKDYDFKLQHYNVEWEQESM